MGSSPTRLTNEFPIRCRTFWKTAKREPASEPTSHEKRTAEDRRDCYWLYVVTRCKQPEGPKLITLKDPARLEWDEIRKIDHYALRLASLEAKT